MVSPLTLARSSARRPKIVVALWVLAFILSIGIAGGFWGKGITAERAVLIDTESNTADKLLEEQFRGPRPVTEIVVVQSDTYTIVDPQFEATVQNLFFDLAALGPEVVAGVSQYYHSGSDYQVSDSGHSTIVSVTMAGTLDEARANVSSIIDLVRRHGGQDEFTVLVIGEASIADRVEDLIYVVMEPPGSILWVLILVLFFQLGSASRLPIIIGFVSVVIPVGASALIEQVFPMSLFSYTTMLTTGAAVGMISTHLIASRYREERTRGFDRLDAIEGTGSTPSRTVLIGGLVAIVASASMSIVPVNTLASIAIGNVIAASIGLLASQTLTPALLALSNDWISGLRLPDQDDPEIPTSPSGRRIDLQDIAQRVTQKALARPVLCAATAAMALLALTALAFRLDLGLTGVESFPERQDRGAYSPQVKRAYSKLTEDFPAGVISPVEIVIDAPFKDPDVEPRIAELQAALASDPSFAGESRIQNNQDHDMILITVPTRDLPESETAHDAVRRLRNVYIPEVFAGAGVDVLVTGGPALAADYTEVVERYAPFMAIVVVVVSILALLISTRSLVIPFLATLAHLLSLGAAYGIVVVALQHGIGAGLGLLRYHHTPTVEIWGLLLSFTLFFGIYTLHDSYLIARIRERYAQTGDTDDTLSYGLKSVIWVSTVASLVMAAIFFVLALGDLPVFHQVGFALTLAALIDAVIVRLILLPSGIRLLGPAAWYFPRILK